MTLATAVEQVRVLPRPVLEAIRAELGPRFANEQQRRFFESEAPELLYSGAFGAGKSRILCEKAYALGKRYPGAPIGIFRKVAASLAATTKLTFMRDVVEEGAIVRSNKTEGWYELANGSRFWFLGLDADPHTGVPSKVGSLDLAFAFVDEAVELSEGDWMMLQGRLRFPGVPWNQIAGATNPADPQHWLKRRFTPSTDERTYLHARTSDNRLLPAAYQKRMAGLQGLYRTRYVEGEWVAVEGALWSPDMIRYEEAPLILRRGELHRDLTRVVVAVDPAVSSGAHSDETGVVVVGLGSDGRAYVLADRSCRLPPEQWAQRVVEAYDEFKADLVVAEVNNGGDLVESVLRTVNTNLSYRGVHASRGKRVRAEPVASLYAQDKVRHVGAMVELENELCSYDPDGAVSPNRLDAMVWGITNLMLENVWSGSSDVAVA